MSDAKVIPLFRNGQPTQGTGYDYMDMARRLIVEAAKRGFDVVELSDAINAVVLDIAYPPEPDVSTAEPVTIPAPSPAPLENPITVETGSKYTGYRRAVDIARDLRLDIKAARRDGRLTLPRHAKVSVTCDEYSMGQAIDIVIYGLTDTELWNNPGAEPDYANNYPSSGGPTPMRRAAEAVLTELAQAYNRRASDAHTDYSNYLFYLHVTSRTAR